MPRGVHHQHGAQHSRAVISLAKRCITRQDITAHSLLDRVVHRVDAMEIEQEAAVQERHWQWN
eukprot:746-Pyramimonas_sp.AAC.1